MTTLDAELEAIVHAAFARNELVHSRTRSFPTRDEQLRMEFALSVVEFLPSNVNLMTYDLSTNPHLPYVLSEDEPWKSALADESQLAAPKRRLPALHLNVRLDLAPHVPEWAAV